jgi:hypothetical protein
LLDASAGNSAVVGFGGTLLSGGSAFGYAAVVTNTHKDRIVAALEGDDQGLYETGQETWSVDCLEN